MACIMTGTVPYDNGIVGERWLDRKTLRPAYCVDDASCEGWLTSERYSPASLSVSTITDELKVATGGRALVYSIAPDADAAILCAAVADFTVEATAASKIKRRGDSLDLRLVPTRDIAAALGEMKRPGQHIAGFALETDNERSNARDKLLRKNFDFIVLNSLNDPGAGFMHDTNKINIITRNEEKAFPLKPKTEVARDIVDNLCKLFNS